MDDEEGLRALRDGQQQAGVGVAELEHALARRAASPCELQVERHVARVGDVTLDESVAFPIAREKMAVLLAGEFWRAAQDAVAVRVRVFQHLLARLVEIPVREEAVSARAGNRRRDFIPAAASYFTTTTGSPSTSIRGVMPRPGAVLADMNPLSRCGAPSAVETVT